MLGRGLSVACVPFYPCGDRFMPGGYREDPYSLEKKLEMIAGMGDVRGVELSFPAEFEDPAPMAEMLKRVGLTPSNVEVEIFGSPKWKFGAFSNPDPAIRSDAVELSKRCVDAAAAIGCDMISLWPGQDGFDYPMQVDYMDAWNWTMEALAEIAERNLDVKIAVEYKIKEPRTHIHFATIGKPLLAALETGAPNVGVMIDFGHATMAYENVAESAVLASRHGKLFHFHLNDNYRMWDDDMIVGSVHLWETFELIHTLRKLKYDGWYSLDIFPYRENSEAAMRQSLDMVKKLAELAEKFDDAKLAELRRESDAAGICALLRESLLR